MFLWILKRKKNGNFRLNDRRTNCLLRWLCLRIIIKILSAAYFLLLRWIICLCLKDKFDDGSLRSDLSNCKSDNEKSVWVCFAWNAGVKIWISFWPWTPHFGEPEPFWHWKNWNATSCRRSENYYSLRKQKILSDSRIRSWLNVTIFLP